LDLTTIEPNPKKSKRIIYKAKLDGSQYSELNNKELMFTKQRVWVKIVAFADKFKMKWSHPINYEQLKE